MENIFSLKLALIFQSYLITTSVPLKCKFSPYNVGSVLRRLFSTVEGSVSTAEGSISTAEVLNSLRNTEPTLYGVKLLIMHNPIRECMV